MAQERSEYSQRSQSNLGSQTELDGASQVGQNRARSEKAGSKRNSASRNTQSLSDLAANFLTEATQYAKEHPILLIAAGAATAGIAFGAGRCFTSSSEPERRAEQLQASAQEMFENVRKQLAEARVPDDVRRYAEAGYQMGTRKLQESVSSNPLTATGILLGIGYLLGNACSGKRSERSDYQDQ